MLLLVSVGSALPSAPGAAGDAAEHLALGTAAAKSDARAAAEHFRAGLKLDPKAHGGWIGLGSALLAMHASSTGASARQLSALCDGAGAQDGCAKGSGAAAGPRLVHRARRCFETALGLAPGHARARKLLARARGLLKPAAEENASMPITQRERRVPGPDGTPRTLRILDGAVPRDEIARVIRTYLHRDPAKGDDKLWGRSYADLDSVWPNAYALAFDHHECIRAPMLNVVRRAARAAFPQCGGGGGGGGAARANSKTRTRSLIAPYNCVLNSQTFADVDQAHLDFTHNSAFWGFTALWYPHEQWDVHWAGATAFTDPAGTDVLEQALPLPGRLVVFDAEIRHMSTPATAISAPLRGVRQTRSARVLGNRFSVAHKFLCTNLTDAEIFRRVDGDGDGRVTLAELGAAHGSGTSPFPPLALLARDKHLLHSADTDGDLRFTRHEFAALLAPLWD
eukprot:g7099.t1